MASSTLDKPQQTIRPALALGVIGIILLAFLVGYFLFALNVPGLDLVRESCRQVGDVSSTVLHPGPAMPDCWLVR